MCDIGIVCRLRIPCRRGIRWIVSTRIRNRERCRSWSSSRVPRDGRETTTWFAVNLRAVALDKLEIRSVRANVMMNHERLVIFRLDMAYKPF